MTQHRKSSVFLAVAAAGLLAAACGSGGGAEADSSQNDQSTQSAEAQHDLSHSGTLAAPDSATDAFTYEQQLAPVGAELAIDVESQKETSTVVLEVTGLQPDRGYAAHAHTENCGPDGDASGPHFQHEQDPNADSETPNPKYVNPSNEIWLDLRTDAEGNGSSEAKLPFAITDWNRPKSVVVHADEKTGTGKDAGAAGDRVACLTIPHTH